MRQTHISVGFDDTVTGGDDGQPTALLWPMAWAYRILVGASLAYEPDEYDLERAEALVKALHKVCLKVVPENLDEDLVASEEGMP
jgi:hypothetical protein